MLTILGFLGTIFFMVGWFVKGEIMYACISCGFFIGTCAGNMAYHLSEIKKEIKKLYGVEAEVIKTTAEIIKKKVGKE